MFPGGSRYCCLFCRSGRQRLPGPWPSEKSAERGKQTPPPAEPRELSLGEEQATGSCPRGSHVLRHLVFAGELGARLDGPEPGLDTDAFDAYCD
ncbi:GNAT family N-acyltransferase, partial [Streptomyces sp. NPDC004779]